jgi:hypothetical protein
MERGTETGTQLAVLRKHWHILPGDNNDKAFVTQCHLCKVETYATWDISETPLFSNHDVSI